MSEKELHYLLDKDFLITKHQITSKIKSLLKEIEALIRQNLEIEKTRLEEKILLKPGKTSTGENYQALPYIVLDYPRLFSSESVFAFRTMFWWGNFISCTLHLQGKTLEQYRPRLLANMDNLSKNDVFLCVATTPWEYHLAQTNYRLLDEITEDEKKEIFQTGSFIKLSRVLPLEKYSHTPVFASETFKLYLKALIY